MDAIICNPPALSVTADNGLTKTVNNIQLGGSLIQQTVITTTFANTFSLLGLVADTNPAYLLSQTSSGVTRITTVASIASIIGIITADNGLTKTGNNIRLGGALVTPTTITAGVTNTLTLAGLQTDAAPDFIVTETTAGVVRRISTTALGTLFGTPVTADNGLTMTSNNIQLGGILIQNTTIDLDGYNIGMIDTSATLVSTYTLTAKNLAGTFEHMSLGNNSLPIQKYGMVIGNNNQLLGTGLYGFAAGVNNTLQAGSASYAIGSTNIVANGSSGALGVSIVNSGFLSHAIGYDVAIPSTNTGTFQVGIFNHTAAIDYNYTLDDVSYPAFSVGYGSQSGISPAERLNIFHVMKNGFVKSKEGHDARSGKRGILPTQWSDLGWSSTGGQTFDLGAKYIIIQYVTGDIFTNVVGSILWGAINLTGFTFIANNNITATTWSNGSTIVKVGRPTSPALGEMGFNLDANQMEYWNGSTWIQF
jgi:hypothetical protein